MRNARPFLKIIFLGCMLLIPFLYMDCGMFRRPVASSAKLSSLNFAHVGITSNCGSCHDTGRPFATFPASGHISTNGQDCAVCHNTTSWLSGLANPHTPGGTPPTSCISCHVSNLPSGQVGLPGMTGNLTPTGGYFDHSSNGGTADCASCHVSNAGVTWSGGIWNHTPGPSTCLGCHNSTQEPVGPVGPNAFDHKNISGSGDCFACHNGANVGKSWAQGTISHSPAPSSCLSCHTSERPAAPAGGPVPMDHSVPPGNGDCVTCHLASVPPGTVIPQGWNGGVLSHSPTPSSCVSCHASERPSAPAGSPVPMDHSVAPGNGDCVTCHLASLPAGTAIPTQGWRGGVLSHSPTPSSCANCHANEKPSGTVNLTNGTDGFDHATTYGTECYSCHTVVSANVGVTWRNGFFNHNNNNASSFGNSCLPCHTHHNTNQNCSDCHTITWPTPSSTGTYGGKFNGGN